MRQGLVFGHTAGSATSLGQAARRLKMLAKGVGQRPRAALALRLAAVLVLLASAVLPSAIPTPARAATAETTFKVDKPIGKSESGGSGPQTYCGVVTDQNGKQQRVEVKNNGGWWAFYSAHADMTVKQVPGAKAYQVYADGEPYGQPFVVPAEKRADPEHTFGVWSIGYDVGVVIPNTDYGVHPCATSDWYEDQRKTLRDDYEVRIRRASSDQEKARLQQELNQKLAEINEAQAKEAAYNLQLKQQALEAYAKQDAEAKREMARGSQPMPNFTKVEAVGLPPVTRLGGTIEVPALPLDEAHPYRITLEGCIKPPAEGGRLEKEDYQKIFAPLIAEKSGAFSAQLLGEPGSPFIDAKVDADGRFRYYLQPGPQTGTLRVVTREPKSSPTTAAPEATLTVKIVKPQELAKSQQPTKRLVRYVDPACGGQSSSEPLDVSSPMVSVSSPQKQLDYPYGYLDYSVEYANPSQTTALKGAALAVKALGQTIYTMPLGDIAAGGKVAVSFKLEMQENGLRLLVNGKEEQLSGVFGNVLTGGQGQGLWKVVGGDMSKLVITIQASLTASGVEPAESEPLQIDVVNWKEKLGAWETKQVAVLKSYKEWQAETKVLDAEGEKLLAAALEPMTVLLQFTKSTADLIDQAYGKDKLKSLAEQGDSWHKNVDGAMKSLVDSQDARIKETYASRIMPVLVKHGFREGMSQEEADRYFESLSPQAKDEVREACRPLQEIVVEVLDRFKREFPEVVQRGEQLHTEAEAMVEKIGDPLERLNDSQRTKVDEAVKKLNALAPRLEKYAKDLVFQREVKKRLAEQMSLLGPEAEALAGELAKVNVTRQSVYEQSRQVIVAEQSFVVRQKTFLEKLEEDIEDRQLGDLFAPGGWKWAAVKREIPTATAKANAVFAVAGVLASKTAGDVAKAALATDAVVIKGLKDEFAANPEAKELLATLLEMGKGIGDLKRPATLNAFDPFGPLMDAPSWTKTPDSLAEELSGTSDLSLAIQMQQAALVRYNQALSSIANTSWTIASQGMIFNLKSPATLLVTDDQGRRTGYDPVAAQSVQDVPGSVYTGPDSKPQYVFVPLPSGEYKVDVTGTGTGQYHVGIARSSFEGTVERLYTGNITPNRTQTYTAMVEAERPLAVRAPGEVAPAAQAKQAAGTPWALWASGSAAIALAALVGALLWRRAQARKPG